MVYPFTKRYFPIHQQEMINDLGDAKDIDEMSTEDIELQESQYSYNSKASSWAIWTHKIPWLLILCLLLSNLHTWMKLKALLIDEAIFSPAVSAIKYKNVVWTAGVEDDKSPYQGRPTEDNNRLWEELYQFGVDRIPAEQAVQLTNRTTPISDDPGYYVVTLDVFHELHCLNMIRKRIFWNESMPEDEQLSLKHMDHCIDSIRQSLMCSSDITPIPYAWYPKFQSVLPTTAVMHTCRDFDSIRDWARERRSFKFDLKTHVEDPLGNVVHIS